MNKENVQTLVAVCAEQKEWQEKNFGSTNDFGWTIIGVNEEVGDLCHAYLKREQNIRNGVEKFQERFVDAIGDIAIYLMGVFNLAGLDFEEIFVHPAPTIDKAILSHKRILLGKIAKYSSRLSTADQVYTLKGEDSDWRNILMFNARGLLFCLDELAKHEGTDLISCVTETWGSVVSDRDWVENPEDGKVTSDK